MTTELEPHQKQRDLSRAIEARIREMYLVNSHGGGDRVGPVAVRDIAWVTAGAAMRHLAGDDEREDA